ncbi:holo-[acyl-carrier-protein] synthase [soil metagenome]
MALHQLVFMRDGVTRQREGYDACMPIVGHGIDIIETARIKQSVEEHGDRFLERVFTDAEREYCARSKKRYFEHLAGRFAAKEAVLKVLGTGWRGGIAWTDIDIVAHSSGQPRFVLSGECLRIAERLGIVRCHVTISHIETHATASAIGLRGAGS